MIVYAKILWLVAVRGGCAFGREVDRDGRMVAAGGRASVARG